MRLLIALVAAAATFNVPPAWAGALTWNVVGGLFDDGGTLTGWFTYDADTGSILNWDFNVAGGNTSVFPPFTYSPADSTAALAATPSAP